MALYLTLSKGPSSRQARPVLAVSDQRLVREVLELVHAGMTAEVDRECSPQALPAPGVEAVAWIEVVRRGRGAHNAGRGGPAGRMGRVVAAATDATSRIPRCRIGRHGPRGGARQRCRLLSAPPAGVSYAPADRRGGHPS